ncbi:aminoglycoside phosphotransferase family protein [Alicyclobacillus fodiniaquatilis]|uniref:Aminoglycoside phosphotransferase family protein n=1 Tax=Alicyclobacillus fodiniaquatilis TaxID=1661150 RepID=A0ABW4JJ14_9BACL
MTLVPDNFKTRVRELYGQAGEDWLQALPQVLDQCQRRFGIRFEGPFENLSWNLILKAKLNDETPVVFKLAVLKEEVSKELRVLRAHAAHGAIRVIEADENLGALVLERAEPGTPLSTIENDDLATEIFTDVFRRLHGAPVNHDLYPSIKEHFKAIKRYYDRSGALQGPLPTYWVKRAMQTLQHLNSTTKEPVLLHGDLHHDNILRQGIGNWVVIDPKGIVGDPHFDAIQFLLNYEDRGSDVDTLLYRRIVIISKHLDLDPHRIAMWGVARGILEACWILENGGSNWSEGIRITERFAKCLDALGGP